MPLVPAALSIHTRLSDVADMSHRTCYGAFSGNLQESRIEDRQPRLGSRKRLHDGIGWAWLVMLAGAIQLSGTGVRRGRGMVCGPFREFRNLRVMR